MGCQVEIAKACQEQGADYILALKENQPSMYAMCSAYSRIMELKALSPQVVIRVWSVH